MTTAKKLFESRMEFLMLANDRGAADKDSVYIDYIFKLEQENKQLRDQYVDIPIHIEELEQKLKDSELRRADLLRTLIKSMSKVQELEYEKAELMKFVKEMNDLGKLSPMRLSDYTDVIYHGSLALLNKHPEKHDAL